MNSILIDQYLNFMFDYFKEDSRIRSCPRQMLENVFLDFLKYKSSDYIIDKYLKIDIARMAYIFHKNRIDTIQYVLSNPNDAIKEVEHANAKEIRLQINR